MKFKLKVFAALCVAVLGIGGVMPALAPTSEAQTLPAKKITLKKTTSAYAIDAKTGEVLVTDNASKAQAVASIAKLLTLYMVVQKIKAKTGSWSSKVNTSYSGLKKMSRDSVVGGFVFKKNSYTVKQLFLAALIDSSNNAAIALGQWVAGGSTPRANRKFIKLMNKQAKKMGLKDSSFVSASGLENDDLSRFGYVYSTKQTYNKVSARDMGKIAYTLLKTYPGILTYSSKTSLTIAGQKVYNVNRMLKGQQYASSKYPTDGLKTGFTTRAQNALVATGKRSGSDRIITVVLHAKGRVYEYANTKKVMAAAYAQEKKIAAKKKALAKAAAAKKAKAAQLSSAIAKLDFRFTTAPSQSLNWLQAMTGLVSFDKLG